MQGKILTVWKNRNKAIRGLIRRMQPICTRFRRNKHILLYCDSITMVPHIQHFYDTVSGIHNTKFYVYYTDAQNGYRQENLEKNLKELIGDRKITPIRRYYGVLLHMWDLIICADMFLPFSFIADDAPALFVNHGNSIVSYDGGEHLYTYANEWLLDSRKKPKFAAMLETNRRYVELLPQITPCLKGRMVHTGDKNYERICREQTKREEYREKLGIHQNEIFVMIFSTWKENSLFHRVGDNLLPQCRELRKDGYRFGLSAHPREYFVYDPKIIPCGQAIEQLRKEGFLVRNPREDYMPYLIAADMVLCDYSSMYETALVAGRKLILSDFPESMVFKYSIAGELMHEIPVFRKNTDLRKLLEEALQNESYEQTQKKFQKLLLPPKEGYAAIVIHLTEALLSGTVY